MREDTTQKDSIALKSYFKDLRKLELVSAQEQTELAIKAKNGDQKAMKKLVESNLRFVLSIAKEYTYTGIPLEDLIQEGNLGIIKAVDRFDETKGFRFISYAVWWIRQSIMQSAYETGSSVRLPVNRINAINKVLRANDALSKELGREPSIREIVDFYTNKETGESELSEKDISSAYTDGGMEISLNSTYSEESGTELHESIEGDGFREIEGNINKNSLKTEIDEVLDELTERESIILKMYFGIGNNQEMTLAEIGEKIGLTNERVRQIKEFALKKLRTYNNSSKLKEFLSCDIK
ncbi:MAG: RNA polymerase sigma factor RpoD/SigA [Nanoarchaeota archaeon]